MAVFWEWFGREVWIILSWWLLVTLAGGAVIPLCWRLLGGLPDRGYTLARTIGMLLVTFIFWLLASFGFFRNTTGSIVLAWLFSLSISLMVYFRFGRRIDWLGWLKENRSVIITAEILFLVLLFGWAVFRAHQNNITATEKPMELAFLSAVQRSETFPPNDPWMSGYAISYYYKGYVMSSMLSMMSGVPSTVGFNMTIAMWFALTGLTAFGVSYNLVRSRAFRLGRIAVESTQKHRTPILTGLLAMTFLILMSNFQAPLIEIPYQAKSVPESYLNFWGTQERSFFGESTFEQDGGTVTVPNYVPDDDGVFINDPMTWGSWWWFRASRVLTDYNLDGTVATHAQPIDEFPAFSFLLSDNHPHVLALPFAVMLIGLALNVLLVGRDPTRYEILLYSICIGGLVFLNTWDGPIYVFAIIGAEALRRLFHNGTGRLYLRDWFSLVKMGVAFTVIVLLAYAPFFIGFRSQASGFLPNLIHPTAFQRFFIMFGPFVLILAVFLMVEAWRGRREQRINWMPGIQISLLLGVGLSILLLVFVVMSSLSPQLNQFVLSFIGSNGGWDVVFPQFILRRITYSLTMLVLLIAIATIVARLFPKHWFSGKFRQDIGEEGKVMTYPPATGFALLLIGMGAVLCLIPEFIYLRDNFSTRINTIFKFYYQAWVLFSLASAYGVYTILADNRLRRPNFAVRTGFSVMLGIILIFGMFYMVTGTLHRMYSETGRVPLSFNYLYTIPADWAGGVMQVLDGELIQTGTPIYLERDTPIGVEPHQLLSQQTGIVHIASDSVIEVHPLLTLDGARTVVTPDDFNVVMCLNNLVQGDDAVVVEAVRDAYNANYGRVGTLTGIPIVLGWENHEAQWRGSTYSEVAGSRKQDIDALYTESDWNFSGEILRRYDIDYILFGFTERQQYGSIGEEKFIDLLPVVCESGNSRIYQVMDTALNLVFP